MSANQPPNPPKNPPQEPHVPKLCRHKSKNPAYVNLDRQMIYLGPWGAPETLERYHPTVAEWLAAGRSLPVDPHEVIINEITVRFLLHAKTYYTRPNGKPSCESWTACWRHGRVCIGPGPSRCGRRTGS